MSAQGFNLRKVKHEWTVGQKVSGDDYVKLPVGSVVVEEDADDGVRSVPIAKTSEYEWTNQGWPGVFISADLADTVRTLTRLGDGVADVEIVERDFFCCAAPSHIHGRIVMPTGERVETMLTVPAVEPEDTDDVYVETEPLTHIAIDTLDREEIHRLITCLPADWGLIEPDGSVLSEVINEVAAALLEFANPTPAQCTSLKDMSDSVRVQCAKDASALVHMHRAVYAGAEVRWPDDEAYGRVEVSS